MNKTNYDKEMNKIIETHAKREWKPTLLLHSCCAPCSTACLERLTPYFDLTVYFYNPNLDTLVEYEKRKNEQIKLCNALGVNCIVEDYSKDDFTIAVRGLEGEIEGGKRCNKCFELRLGKTAEKTKQLKCDYFTTTLTVSPHKNSQLINEVGKKVGDEFGVKFLPSDFKKGGGFLRSTVLSNQYGLYRQNYCGCEYSKGQKI